MLCAYFYCWFVCIFQNIHEIEKEYVFSSSKDAKSKRGVMILMNSNTCQFEMFGENKWKDGFVYMLSFNDSKLQTFLPLLLKVGYWVWIIDNPSTWNIIKLEVFFIVVVFFFFDISLFFNLPLITHSSAKYLVIVSSIPKLILYDGSYFSPFFLFFLISLVSNN